MKRMCTITEFNLPSSESEITALFNEEAKGFYIYHGTSYLYHDEICKNGFTGCYSIFKNNELENLVSLLDRIGMSDCKLPFFSGHLKMENRS